MNAASISKPASVLGMMMLGDAIAFTVNPRAHVAVWRFRREPRWYRRAVAYSRDPQKAPAIALGEAALGLGFVLLADWLARRRR